MNHKPWITGILILTVFAALVLTSPLAYTLTKMPVSVDSNRNMALNAVAKGTPITKEIIDNDYYIVINYKTESVKIKCDKEQFAAVDDLKQGIYYFIYQTSVITKNSKLLAINKDGRW